MHRERDSIQTSLGEHDLPGHAHRQLEAVLGVAARTENTSTRVQPGKVLKGLLEKAKARLKATERQAHVKVGEVWMTVEEYMKEAESENRNR